VFPALVLELSEVMSPVDSKVTVDLVAAPAGAVPTAARPLTVKAATAVAASIRVKRFAFICFSLLITGSVTVCKQMHPATSPWVKTTLKRISLEINKKFGILHFVTFPLHLPIC
jgi:hypothetical protein